MWEILEIKILDIYFDVLLRDKINIIAYSIYITDLRQIKANNYAKVDLIYFSGDIYHR